MLPNWILTRAMKKGLIRGSSEPEKKDTGMSYRSGFRAEAHPRRHIDTIRRRLHEHYISGGELNCPPSAIVRESMRGQIKSSNKTALDMSYVKGMAQIPSKGQV